MVPRRLVALGLAASLLAGTGIAVAAGREGSDETVAPTPTTTVQPVDTTSSTVPDIIITTTTTAPVIVTSTPPSSRVTSTLTTVRPPTAPTTTTGAIAFCKPAQIDVTIITDQPSYSAGQEVKATSTLRNKSSDTCFYNGYGFTSAFKDTTGKTFIGPSVVADSFADVPMRPGQTITHSGTWDQRLCSGTGCGRAPAGAYIAAATWNFAASTYEATVGFVVG